MLKFKNKRVEEHGNIPRKATWVTAICFCGGEYEVRFESLKSGHSKSCGCFHEKHGMGHSLIYQIWKGMIYRCKNKNNKNYKGYGARGISVSEEWHSFIKFFSDMGERPDGKSLDRIDNDGNYCKANCRWASAKEQQRNTRSNITYDGECASVASRRLGGSENLVTSRIRNGWSVERAFTKQVIKK